MADPFPPLYPKTYNRERLSQAGEAQADQNVFEEKLVPVGEDPRGTGLQETPGRGASSQFLHGSDPISREGLMSNLASRRGSPSMEAAQAGGTTVGPAATIGGAGTTALGGMASGQVGAGMQAQHDRTLRAISAQQAGVRGSQNVGLAARGAQSAMGQAGAELAGKAGELQLGAAQASAGIEAQQAKLNQDITTLQANLQQQLNLSNAEMQQMANKVNLEVEAQLNIERDKRMNELMRMGVDREIAEFQAQEEAWKFKSELIFNYWQATAQDRLGRDIAILEDTSTSMPWNPDAEDIMGEKYESPKILGDVGESFEDVDLGTESSLIPDVGANIGTLTGGEIGADNAVRGLDSFTQSKSGGMAEMDAGYDYSGEGYPGNKGIAEEALTRELSTAEDIKTAERVRIDEAVETVKSTLETMGDIHKYGGLAMDILGGTKADAADRMVQQARAEGEQQLTDFLASDEGAGMGRWAGPAVQAGSLAFDVATEDNPAINPKEQTAYGARKIAAGTGGAALGSWLGGMAGGAIGTMGGPVGTAIGTAVGEGIGGTLGAIGGTAADEALLGGMPTRTIHTGNIENKGRIQPSVTSADLQDPANLPKYQYESMGEKFESPSYGGRQRNLAELEELRRRLNGGR